MGADALPDEPIVALDEVQSEEALLHPLDAAVSTIVQAFAKSPPALLLAREGRERELTSALLALYRSTYGYEVVEAGDFCCVALVRQVPEVVTAGDEDAEEAAAMSRYPAVPTSRAEASANIEPRRHRAAGSGVAAAGGGSATGGATGSGGKAEGQGVGQGQRQGAAAVDPARLQGAMATGSLDDLLSLGLPRLEAEVLLHVRPERLGALRQMNKGLEARLQQYAQAHGPLLHLHFLATLPGEQGAGRGRRVLRYLERMADAEGRTLYLEASSGDSRRLYLRHGFQDVEDVVVGDSASGGVTFHIMARPPGAKSASSSESELAGEAQGAEGQVAPGSGGPAAPEAVQGAKGVAQGTPVEAPPSEQ
ncbi:hypothetical protein ABPG75_006805 [Micractinium tetrahymenae]